MKAFRTDLFPLPLPPDHRFPIEKYRKLCERIERSQFPFAIELLVPEPASDAELLRAHSQAYLDRLTRGTLSDAEQRRIGFPWSPEVVERSRRSTGATISACRAALEEGVAVNLAGGTHHAFRDAGEGFCLFNDSVVAARAMQAEGRASRVVVIDLDVHQGNGTAALCRDDPTIFTFSVHGAKNFPLRKEISDLDVELPDGITDAEYLATCEQGLFETLHRFQADLAIYLAGADPFEGDRLGRLKVSKAALARRTAMVLEACWERRLPVAVTMAGGYAHHIEDTVDLYFDTVQQCGAWSIHWRR
ncbi:MAG: histone deacetylase [Gemmataceae bacterium]